MLPLKKADLRNLQWNFRLKPVLQQSLQIQRLWPYGRNLYISLKSYKDPCNQAKSSLTRLKECKKISILLRKF